MRPSGRQAEFDRVFPHATVTPAGPDEAEALAAFVNRAYRGAAAREGWAHEADLIEGQRTDAAMLAAEIAGPGAILVMRAGERGATLACVSTHPRRKPGGDGCYFGMLAVDPDRQGRGIGRRMVAVVEARAEAAGCVAAEITVIHLRATLIAWYERLGYRRTGRSEPFPYGDERFGLPKRDDLRLIVLEKPLAVPA